jgi:hypothetical protein
MITWPMGHSNHGTFQPSTFHGRHSSAGKSNSNHGPGLVFNWRGEAELEQDQEIQICA